jgi:sugar O-acyltransferase (sialic acid O-acetyltransferase NeuD family)
MKNIIIIGAGGHASSLLDLIESTKKYKILGFLCNKKKIGINFNGYKILGKDNYLKKIKKNKPLVALGFSSYKNLDSYKKKFLEIKSQGFLIPSIISRHSYVSKKVKIGEGVNIFHGVIVNNNCIIDNGVTINSKTLIEHDCHLSSFVHISTGCIINGSVRIGEKSFIGSGTVIKENIKINKKKFIKMRSSVIKDL